MMTDEQIIEVVRAHMEGKQIEVKWIADKWADCLPTWNFEQAEYRVKPEPRKPREWWLIEDKSRPIYYQPSFVGYPSRQLGCDSNEQIHVREVIEE